MLVFTDHETGKVHIDKVKENLNLAVSAYISTIDGCPFGATTIKLFRASNSEECQKIKGHQQDDL